MGDLFVALDKVLQRKVAIKILRKDRRNDPEAAVRFLQEARIHSQFSHPNIPPLHDIGRLSNGRPFLAIKYIRGRTLGARLNQPCGPVDWEFWRGVFAQVCRAIAYAHSKGVVHRDLTPSNILVSERGRVQVIDWGLSKVIPVPSACADTTLITVPNLSNTDAGIALGTPAFMPPEATTGAVASVQGDVFGLGSVLCYMLTGRPLYEGNKSTVIRLIKAGDLRPALERLSDCDGPHELVTLAKVCLSTDRDKRPQSALDVLAALAAPNQPAKQGWWVRLLGRK
jgi:serine/threonine-protein kinase